MPSIIHDIDERAVEIHLDGYALNADLMIPRDARGLVIFAHGSGSSRRSARNRAVASVLWEWDFATLLLDLLTPIEERIDYVTQEFRFDVELLADRLVTSIDWSAKNDTIADLPIGLFGASTGAAAALIAAAERPDIVRAVVSRGGRIDLADGALARVTAPTLCIVGSYDQPVLDLNRASLREITSTNRLEVIHGATHLFEEPGTLEQVSELAAEWFAEHLPL